MDKIDKSRLKSIKSNPEWKLHINFESFYQSYEDRIQELIAEVKVKEKDLYEK